MKGTYTLFGYYHYNNCGDEALLAACKKVFGNIPYTTPKTKEPLTGNVILGGGDIINPFFLNKVRHADDVKVFGAGLGYESEIEMLSDCKLSAALLRNKKDVEIALAHGINARYTPDIVFNLDPPKKTKHVKKHKGKKLLGVMLADSISESYKQKDPVQIHYGSYLKAALSIALCDLREYYKIVFIPMCHARYQYDIKMMYEVVSNMPAVEVDHEFIEPNTPPHTVMEIVGELDLLATMRFHGLVFATLAGTPVINIGVTRKTQTFMEENALTQLNIDPFAFSPKVFLDRVKAAEAEGTRALMAERCAINRQDAAEAVRWIEETW